MACETPTILSRLPRYEEIVQHEESAYFVEPNPEALAAGIMRLLDDAQLRGRIVKQGRRIVAEQADLDEQAAIVERRYRASRPRLVRARSGSRRSFLGLRRRARVSDLPPAAPTRIAVRRAGPHSLPLMLAP